MIRKSFTLLEVIISVALLGIMFTYLYSTLDGLRKSTAFYNEKLDDFEKEQKVIDILYRDLSLSTVAPIFLEKDSKDFTILKLTTLNSIHGISNPIVLWYVDKNFNLNRVESSRDISMPMKFEDIVYSFSDSTMKDLEYFRVFKSNNNSAAFVYLKNRKKNSIFFEVNLYIIPNGSKSKRRSSNQNSINTTESNTNTMNQSSSIPMVPGI